MIRSILATALVLTPLLCECQSHPRILGKWMSSTHGWVKFEPDHSFSLGLGLGWGYPYSDVMPPKDGWAAYLHGRWSMSGAKVTVRLTRIGDFKPSASQKPGVFVMSEDGKKLFEKGKYGSTTYRRVGR